jgi:hypothetical protein
VAAALRVLVEKVVPRADRLAPLDGLALVALGAWLLAKTLGV